METGILQAPALHQTRSPSNQGEMRDDYRFSGSQRARQDRQTKDEGEGMKDEVEAENAGDGIPDSGFPGAQCRVRQTEIGPESRLRKELGHG